MKAVKGISEAEFLAQVIDYAHLTGWIVAHFRPLRRANGSWETPVQGDGVGWVTRDLEFVDGLLLPIGCRVSEFEAKKHSDDLMAAKSCASRIERETGERPMIVATAGALRVIEQRFLTDIKPVIESKPKGVK